MEISTHDLHTEVDIVSTIITFVSGKFQLTTSTRRSTQSTAEVMTTLLISTHDLHTEVDPSEAGARLMDFHISTHDLHTEVDEKAYNAQADAVSFQLTTSTRRST